MPPLGRPGRNIAITEKLEWCGYPTVKKIRGFDTILASDGQTDRHLVTA